MNVIKLRDICTDTISYFLSNRPATVCCTMKGSSPTLGASLVILVVALSAHWQDAAAFDSVICHQTGKYLVGNPRDCRSYYYCFEGQAFDGLCAAGYRFDEARQSCLQATVGECFACPPVGVAHLSHPAGCHRYVLCFHGVAHERLCQPGTLYNAWMGQCDLQANVVCSTRS